MQVPVFKIIPNNAHNTLFYNDFQKNYTVDKIFDSNYALKVGKCVILWE